MLKFMLMPDSEKFLSLVDKSRGEVLLHLPDKTHCSLKHDRTARQTLCSMQPGTDGISISIANPEDASMFLHYMMEAAR